MSTKSLKKQKSVSKACRRGGGYRRGQSHGLQRDVCPRVCRPLFSKREKDSAGNRAGDDASIPLFCPAVFFSRRPQYEMGKAANKKNILKYVKWYTPEKEKRYPTSFKVDFVGEPYEGACYYRITRCPICTYTEKLGVAELMPLFCELDEVMIGLQHGVLHRKGTIAKGADCCDYFITGDRE